MEIKKENKILQVEDKIVETPKDYLFSSAPNCAIVLDVFFT